MANTADEEFLVNSTVNLIFFQEKMDPLKYSQILVASAKWHDNFIQLKSVSHSERALEFPSLLGLADPIQKWNQRWPWPEREKGKEGGGERKKICHVAS